MPAAPKPADEAIRLARLRALNILDTAPEAVFESFTRLARSILEVPISAVGLMDKNRQWFKSIRASASPRRPAARPSAPTPS